MRRTISIVLAVVMVVTSVTIYKSTDVKAVESATETIDGRTYTVTRLAGASINGFDLQGIFDRERIHFAWGVDVTADTIKATIDDKAVAVDGKNTRGVFIRIADISSMQSGEYTIIITATETSTGNELTGRATLKIEGGNTPGPNPTEATTTTTPVETTTQGGSAEDPYKDVQWKEVAGTDIAIGALDSLKFSNITLLGDKRVEIIVKDADSGLYPPYKDVKINGVSDENKYYLGSGVGFFIPADRTGLNDNAYNLVEAKDKDDKPFSFVIRKGNPITTQETTTQTSETTTQGETTSVIETPTPETTTSGGTEDPYKDLSWEVVENSTEYKVAFITPKTGMSFIQKKYESSNRRVFLTIDYDPTAGYDPKYTNIKLNGNLIADDNMHNVGGNWLGFLDSELKENAYNVVTGTTNGGKEFSFVIKKGNPGTTSETTTPVETTTKTPETTTKTPETTTSGGTGNEYEGLNYVNVEGTDIFIAPVEAFPFSKIQKETNGQVMIQIDVGNGEYPIYPNFSNVTLNGNPAGAYYSSGAAFFIPANQEGLEEDAYNVVEATDSKGKIFHFVIRKGDPSKPNYKPKALVASQQADTNNILINWEAPRTTEGVVGYTVKIGSDIIVDLTTEKSYTHTMGDFPSGSYNVTVSSVDSEGSILDSATTTFNYKDPESVDSKLSVTYLWEGLRRENLYWTPVEGATGYAVYTDGRLCQTVTAAEAKIVKIRTETKNIEGREKLIATEDANGEENIKLELRAFEYAHMNEDQTQQTTIGLHTTKVVALFDDEEAPVFEEIKNKSVIGTDTFNLYVNYIFGRYTDVWNQNKQKSLWAFTVNETKFDKDPYTQAEGCIEPAKVQAEFQWDGTAKLTIESTGKHKGYKSADDPGDQVWMIKVGSYNIPCPKDEQVHVEYDIYGPKALKDKTIYVKICADEANENGYINENVYIPDNERPGIEKLKFELTEDGERAVAHFSENFHSVYHEYDLLFGIGMLQLPDDENKEPIELTFTDPQVNSTYGIEKVNAAAVYPEGACNSWNHSIFVNWVTEVPERLEKDYSYEVWIGSENATDDELVLAKTTVGGATESGKVYIPNNAGTEGTETDPWYGHGTYKVQVRSFYHGTETDRKSTTVDIKDRDDMQSDLVISKITVSPKENGENHYIGEEIDVKITVKNLSKNDAKTVEGKENVPLRIDLDVFISQNEKVEGTKTDDTFPIGTVEIEPVDGVYVGAGKEITKTIRCRINEDHDRKIKGVGTWRYPVRATIVNNSTDFVTLEDNYENNEHSETYIFALPPDTIAFGHDKEGKVITTWPQSERAEYYIMEYTLNGEKVRYDIEDKMEGTTGHILLKEGKEVVLPSGTNITVWSRRANGAEVIRAKGTALADLKISGAELNGTALTVEGEDANDKAVTLTGGNIYANKNNELKVKVVNVGYARAELPEGKDWGLYVDGKAVSSTADFSILDPMAETDVTGKFAGSDYSTSVGGEGVALKVDIDNASQEDGSGNVLEEDDIKGTDDTRNNFATIKVMVATGEGWRTVGEDLNVLVGTGEGAATVSAKFLFYDEPNVSQVESVVSSEGKYLEFAGNSSFSESKGDVSVKISKGVENEEKLVDTNFEESDYVTAISTEENGGSVKADITSQFNAGYKITYYLVKITKGSVKYTVKMKTEVTPGNVKVKALQMNTATSEGAVSEFNPSFRIVSEAGRAIKSGDVTEITEGSKKIENYPISTIENFGTLYTTNTGATTDNMVLGDSYTGTGEVSNGIYAYEATPKGKLKNWSGADDKNSDYYALTFRSKVYSLNMLDTRYTVRAYAKLTDGKIVYGDNVVTTSVYNIAEVLYNNNMMSSQTSHDFLYDNVLNIVTIKNWRLRIANEMINELRVTTKEDLNYTLINNMYKDLYRYINFSGVYRKDDDGQEINYYQRGVFKCKTLTDNETNLLEALNQKGNSSYTSIADWIESNGYFYQKREWNSIPVVSGENV